uniref:Uncharacterized protein n=1 Tax=Anguilla anguilla TaxID=7936 RepID=A0A0E9RVE9_ANGAN
MNLISFLIMVWSSLESSYRKKYKDVHTHIHKHKYAHTHTTAATDVLALDYSDS